MKRRKADVNCNGSLREKILKWRSNHRLFLSCVCLISALTLSLDSPCAAQSGYEIRNAIVTPEYGYEDFTYSADLWISEDVARDMGKIAVTKFSLKFQRPRLRRTTILISRSRSL